MKLTTAQSLLTAAFGAQVALSDNSTYYNPIIPGWNSDPSCIYHEETFFCVTSTFLVAPGLPVYASKDLVNWDIASYVWTRPDQFGLPNAARNLDYQAGGFYAATIRFHDGKFYVIDTHVGGENLVGTIFTTETIYDRDSWSDALVYNASAIDPDLYWDDDGTVWLHSAGIIQQQIDLETGEVTEPVSLWNGTGGTFPEGPHIYKRDGWYYLLIAEGGTELNHMATVARSRHITGPYESNPENPILSNANTTQYFQTVGHADLFQDGDGNWWGAALSTRSGPEWEIYPMGRESVLYPVTWEEGEWPVPSQVRGVMSGWPLPPPQPYANASIQPPNSGYNSPEHSIDERFSFWRYPHENTFAVSPPGHPTNVQIRPSRANLTGVLDSDDKALTGKEGLSFIGQKQRHTLFSSAVDVVTNSLHTGEEAGITAFLTQVNHIDLGMAKDAAAAAELRLRIEISGTENSTVPSSVQRTAVPAAWLEAPSVRLEIATVNSTHYAFKAWPSDNPNAMKIIGHASAYVVSGGAGPFMGTLVGAYATCDGAGEAEEYFCPGRGDGEAVEFKDWGYEGVAQEVDFGEFVF